MKRAIVLLSALGVAGCSYFQKTAEKPAPTKTSPAPAKRAPTITSINSGPALISAMHDRYADNTPKTISFLQNNTSYTTTGDERKSQWYEHLEYPGKLRIAFLPATQRSGLVQVGDRVATFDNGIRVDFRPSVNPLLLLTADVFSANQATIMRGLDSLHVDTNIIRTDEWEGRPVFVLGARAGDSTSNQAWIDAERMLLVRFIQNNRNTQRPIISDIRVKTYKEIDGYQIPTEFLTIRNGRPVWREQYADVRVNQVFPDGTFDQARWKDIPIPQ
jgi:hypothetical protein